MQIDLKLLKTIRAVAQTGSMQGAAGRLFVTQSALSHQLKEIELQLGQPLFVRKSQPVQFSWQGQLLLQLADEVLPKIDAVQTQLKQQPELPAQLRLTVECHACFHWLLPAVKAFRQQWLQVALNLDTEIEHHAIEAMLAGDLPRLNRMLDGLKGEGEPLVLILWSVTEELRILSKLKAANDLGEPIAQLMRANRIWGNKERLYPMALKRVQPVKLRRAMQIAAGLDRQAKGLHAADLPADPWDGLRLVGNLLR